MTRLQKYWGVAVTAALMAVTLWNGLRSLDFGFHWDEPVHLETVKIALADQTFLPAGFYHYPSLLFFLTVLVRLGQRVLEPLGVGQADYDFILLGRALFLIVTVSGTAFLYAAGRRLSNQLGGVAAVVVFLSSWQLTYHARWIAPDALLTSICAIFIWTMVRRATTPQARLAHLGPYLIAGLAASTKYQGAFLVLSAIGIDLLLRDAHSVRQTVIRIAKGILGFLVVFVAITPGVVIQPIKVYAAIRDRAEHYSEGHGYHLGAQSEVIDQPLSMGFALLRSIALDFTSRQSWLSVVVFILSIIGIVILGRSKPRLVAALMIGPTHFFIYSLTLVVFIIRNFLLFLPFVALFAGLAIGAFWASRRIPNPVRWAAPLALTAYAVFGMAAQTQEATDITNRGPEQLARMIEKYVKDQSATVCILSTSAVKSLLNEHGITTNERDLQEEEDRVYLILSSQLASNAPVKLDEWPGTQSRWFGEIGTREVDFSHYPRWSGDPRALTLTPNKIVYLGLDENEQQAIGVSSGCLQIR